MSRKPLNNEKLKSIQAEDIDTVLQMLKTYLDAQDIKPLLASLETLRTDPQNAAHQQQVADAFYELGPLQGAVLTYAPMLHIFSSDDPFADL